MHQFLKSLWDSYLDVTPEARDISQLLKINPNEPFKDHVAFRTIQHPKFGINALSVPFFDNGYEISGEYHFKEKKLNAIHLENRKDPSLPKIFVSELLLHRCSSFARKTLVKAYGNFGADNFPLVTAGRNWEIDYYTYHRLIQESEYAAWLYAHGYRVNHFTVSVNRLENQTIETICALLYRRGFTLNNMGGIIKGSQEKGLKQASIMASRVPMYFTDLKEPYEIPSCYVEFAERFDINGELFQGFLVKSADKIFESTNSNFAA